MIGKNPYVRPLKEQPDCRGVTFFDYFSETENPVCYCYIDKCPDEDCYIFSIFGVTNDGELVGIYYEKDKQNMNYDLISAVAYYLADGKDLMELRKLTLRALEEQEQIENDLDELYGRNRTNW